MPTLYIVHDYNRRDQSRLSYGIGYQKAYNSDNICQKILFFILYIVDIILIYGVK